MNDERPKADVIEKVRKILERTERNNCTSSEAETAFAMASRMMAEHNLSIDEVKSASGGDDWDEQNVFETGKWSLENNLVYGIVKEFFFIEGVFTKSTIAGPKTLVFFGKDSNVQVAKWTWNALHAAFDRLWTNYKIINGQPASERRLYVAGLAKGFTEKLRDEREVIEIERDIASGSSGGTALALVNVNKETEIAFHEKHPSRTASKAHFSKLEGDKNTLRAGYEAGKSLNLNRAIGGKVNGRKAIGN